MRNATTYLLCISAVLAPAAAWGEDRDYVQTQPAASPSANRDAAGGDTPAAWPGRRVLLAPVVRTQGGAGRSRGLGESSLAALSEAEAFVAPRLAWRRGEVSVPLWLGARGSSPLDGRGGPTGGAGVSLGLKGSYAVSRVSSAYLALGNDFYRSYTQDRFADALYKFGGFRGSSERAYSRVHYVTVGTAAALTPRLRLAGDLGRYYGESGPDGFKRSENLPFAGREINIKALYAATRTELWGLALRGRDRQAMLGDRLRRFPYVSATASVRVALNAVQALEGEVGKVVPTGGLGDTLDHVSPQRHPWVGRVAWLRTLPRGNLTVESGYDFDGDNTRWAPVERAFAGAAYESRPYARWTASTQLRLERTYTGSPAEDVLFVRLGARQAVGRSLAWGPRVDLYRQSAGERRQSDSETVYLTVEWRPSAR